MHARGLRSRASDCPILSRTAACRMRPLLVCRRSPRQDEVSRRKERCPHPRHAMTGLEHDPASDQAAAPLASYAATLRRARTRRSAGDAQAIPDARPDHVLPRPAADRRRAHAVPLGRDRQAVSRRLRRHRHRLGRPLPSEIVEKVREQVGTLQHTTTIYLHPTIGTFGKKLAEHMPAGQRSVGQLFHQLRQRGERDRHPDGARVHRALRGHRLRNGYHGGTQARDGADRPRHLEVPEQPAARRQARHARLLLSLPVRPDVSRAAM